MVRYSQDLAQLNREVADLIVSFAVGYLARNVLGVPLPDFVIGVVGGLAALPVWEFVKRVGPK